MREAALIALLNGIFEGNRPTKAMLALFDAPWNPAITGTFSLFFRATDPTSRQEILTDAMHLNVPEGTDAERSVLRPIPAFAIEIGPAPGEGLVFTVPR